MAMRSRMPPTLSTAREDIHNMELALEEKRLAKDQAAYEAPTIQRQAAIDYEKAERALTRAKALKRKPLDLAVFI